MQNRTSRYRYGFVPSAPGADVSGLSIGIRRVDGDPDGGTPGLRTSSDGIDIELLLSDLRTILGSLPAADEFCGPAPTPVRTWAFEGINGPFVMRLTKPSLEDAKSEGGDHA